MYTDKAPVALFVYNRPRHLQRTLSALAANEGADATPLFVFSDGAKADADAASVEAVRRIAGAAEGFQSVELVARPDNWGLSRNIIDGVTSVCKSHGRLIAIEDDLVTSPYFLRYMHEGLVRYENKPQVMQIAGHSFLDRRSSSAAVFLPMTTSWGWATWDRAWRLFDPEAKGISKLESDDTVRDAFDLGGAFNYYDILRSQLAGDVESWAIRWYLTVFLAKGLVLYPPYALVNNTGFDGSGTHRRSSVATTGNGMFPEIMIDGFPAICLDRAALAEVRRALKRGGIKSRIAALAGRIGLKT